MTRAEYITKCQAEVDDDSTRAKTVLETAFSDTYWEIIRRLGKFLIEEEETSVNSVAGQRYITLPEKFSRISRAWYKDTSFRELELMNPYDYNPNLADGTPSKFYVKGGRLYFDKAPESSALVKLQWTPKPAEPSDSTNIEYIDDEMASLLVYGTTARFMNYEEGGDQSYSNRYYNDLREWEMELATQQLCITKMNKLR